MNNYPILNLDNAPEAAKPLLEKSKKDYGMIPNLHGVMAAAPGLLKAYQDVGELFTNSSLTTVEQNVVWMTINYENNCHYCVPAHTMIAKGAGVDDSIIEALRNGTPIADSKLQALREFTIKIVEKRGFVSEADQQAFFAAGYTPANVLDVILGMAHKVMSNYTNHITKTEVDVPFAKFAWTKPEAKSLRDAA